MAFIADRLSFLTGNPRSQTQLLEIGSADGEPDLIRQYQPGTFQLTDVEAVDQEALVAAQKTGVR